MLKWLSLFADISSFQAFFNYIDMRVLLENFCVYHVNAPGQEEGSPALPEEWVNVQKFLILPPPICLCQHSALERIFNKELWWKKKRKKK